MRGHRHGPPWMAMDEGFGEWGRRRMRRGDIRAAILSVLAESPGHGYEVMRTLEERSGGMWRPSPGSVYPTLEMLEDEGLVRSEQRDDRRVYELTDAGRTEAQASAERAPSGPWGGGDHPARELGDEAKRLMSAFRNVVRTANKEQSVRAVAILRDARKQLYQLLAED